MENQLTWHMTDAQYGKAAQNRLNAAQQPTLDGALAALESFYFSFNQQDIKVFEQVWAQHELIQLNNPLGGIQRGYEPIRDLYRRIYDGPAQVWVEFYDIMVFFNGTSAVFAGRERGDFTLGAVTVPLDIRTTRFFSFFEDDGWRQVHHHGSIDDSVLLRTYQNAVRGDGTASQVMTAARVVVKSEQVDAFLDATQALIEASNQEEGVHFFHLYHSIEAENAFIFYEIFASQAALEAHRSESHTQTWFATVSDMLDSSPTIQNLLEA